MVAGDATTLSRWARKCPCCDYGTFEPSDDSDIYVCWFCDQTESADALARLELELVSGAQLTLMLLR